MAVGLTFKNKTGFSDISGEVWSLPKVNVITFKSERA